MFCRDRAVGPRNSNTKDAIAVIPVIQSPSENPFGQYQSRAW